MLAKLSLEEFIDRLAAGTPTPGGGSAAALAGCLAASLVQMVCDLTIGREAYRDHEPALVVIREKAQKERRELLALVDRDARAYDAVVAALRLPRATEAEKAARQDALSKASLLATETPLATAEACATVLEMTVELAAKGNRNAASDVGTAATLALAALLGAIQNVRINLGGIADAGRAAAAAERARALEGQGERLKMACFAALASGAGRR